jgi:GDPmannose 4,6-dehydratase
MSRKNALITGITGQDGSYLAEFLLAHGYSVHGIVLQSELEDSRSLHRIADIRDRVVLHAADLGRFESIGGIVSAVRPSECYHLAAQSFVNHSATNEAATLNTNIGGTQTVLAALRTAASGCRFFFASSSEMFGGTLESPQTEQTPVSPRSVYGVSKAAGYFLTRCYRELHGMHASCGILYNHESPRRGGDFVTRKITLAVARIAAGSTEKLRLGNLDSRRDWGHARDYVRAMWLAVQQDRPSDYVIATGVTHSVRDFCDLAFRRAGLRYQDWVETDPAFYRPPEPVVLVGNPAQARANLGWGATTRFEDLVCEMADHDMRLAGIEPREESLHLSHANF